MANKTIYMFPSPFGVHVLKSIKAMGITPLRFMVSVPFRGSRSEIGGKLKMKEYILNAFPSPFGVHVLK